MAYTLVIIDMQPGFDSSFDESIKKPILREIKLAKKNKYPIIVLEYDPEEEGETLDYIQKELADYSIKMYLSKSKDDGSSKITRNSSAKEFRICGVNLTCCVWDTYSGLLKKNRKPTIVKDAVSDELSEEEIDSFCEMRKEISFV